MAYTYKYTAINPSDKWQISQNLSAQPHIYRNIYMHIFTKYYSV